MNFEKERLNEILEDMIQFAKIKGIEYQELYLLGGSGCILANYFDRGTTDFDILDLNYKASMGILFRLLESYDFLDLYLTTIPEDFKNRVIKIKENEKIFVLSREDIILSKIGRYSDKDKEDIRELLKQSNIELLNKLIIKVLSRKNISLRVLNGFTNNLKNFREDFNV